MYQVYPNRSGGKGKGCSKLWARCQDGLGQVKYLNCAILLLHNHMLLFMPLFMECLVFIQNFTEHCWVTFSLRKNIHLHFLPTLTGKGVFSYLTTAFFTITFGWSWHYQSMCAFCCSVWIFTISNKSIGDSPYWTSSWIYCHWFR